MGANNINKSQLQRLYPTSLDGLLIVIFKENSNLPVIIEADNFAELLQEGAFGDLTVSSITTDNGEVKPFKSYVAELTQAGDTSAPVATVLENNLSGPIVWTRTGVGVYVGTLSAAFTANKTVLTINMPPLEIGSEVVASFQRTSANAVTLSIYEADGSTATEGFTSTVEIKVYN